jgi:hypothetical protein
MSDMTLVRVEEATKKVEASSVELSTLQALFTAKDTEIGNVRTGLQTLENKFAGISFVIPLMPYVILKADITGQTDTSAAIIEASNAAVANKTYRVLFPTGSYLVKPGLWMPEGVEWISFGNAILFTKETTPYNIILSMRNGCKLTHLTFDQRQDAAMMPVRSDTSPKGLFIIHIPNLNDVTIQDCMLYPCGVCAIISQHQFTNFGFNINTINNTIVYQRKVEPEFDATMIFMDAMSGKIVGNNIKSIKTSVTNGWKFETGIEVHSPNMLVEHNNIDGCVNGIIPTAYPGLYPSFDDTFRGCLRIINNNIKNAVRGITYWGSPINNTPTTARNAIIENNYINLKLEKRPKTSYYYPAEGIGFEDHSSSTTSFYFKHIQIRKNIIETTYEAGLNPKALLDYAGVPCPQGGAFNMQTKYPCEDFDISDNDVTFPYGIFNIKAAGTAVHKNIRAYNNRFFNPAIYHEYLSAGFDGVYNFENVNGFIANNNTIYGTPIEVRQNGANVNNVSII